MSETLITLLVLGVVTGGVIVYVLNYKPMRKSKVKDLYAEGLDLLITGKRKSAYKNFQDIIQKDSDNIKALEFLKKAYFYNPSKYSFYKNTFKLIPNLQVFKNTLVN